MKITDENTVRLSVRELVEFVLRSGDIDNRRSSARIQDAMILGANAHRRLQGSAGTNYAAEVSLKTETVVGNGEVCLQVEGRADGIISDFNGEEEVPGEVTIDEIKGIYRDINALEGPEPVHLAQAQVYAYILCAEAHLDHISVQITYVQLEEEKKRKNPIVTDEVRRFVFHYPAREIEDLFFHYVELYEKWAVFIVDHRRKRKETVQGFPFPFPYRPGQKTIAAAAYRAMAAREKLFVQAPTGIGKTLSMLFPAVQAVGQELGDKIFYLTAKTVTAAVAEEGMRLMAEKGLGFSYVKITAKEKVCPLAEMHCDPVHCERAKGHMDRVNDAVYDLITHENGIGMAEIVSYAEKHNVCPYEMSLDVSYYTDVIIGDYNYAFAPHVALQRYFGSETPGDYLFLIDEAHNLVDRARDMYSAVLVKEDILAAKKLFENRKRILKALEKANKLMLEMKREHEGAYVYAKEEFPNALILALAELREAISQFMDQEPNHPKGDEIADFFFEVSDFIDTAAYLDEGYLAYSDFMENGSFCLKLFCIDPSGRLRERLDNVNSTVFFSATLLPIHYYKELLTGNREEKAVYVDSPFDPANRRIYIGRDVSTKYTRRSPAEYEKIGTYIREMVLAKDGNYLAFFPSHKFLEEVQAVLLKDGEFLEGCRVIAQKRNMGEQDRAEFLGAFAETEREAAAAEEAAEEATEEAAEEADEALAPAAANSETPAAAPHSSLLGLAVMGGVFSEGIDLRKDALIGVAVVGTGLPQVCTERELIRRYYEERGEDGFSFAYRFPGFNKVQQAAGRLIRTSEDEGVILLLDERFGYRESRNLFPREWEDAEQTDLSKNVENMRIFWNSRKLT